jgi:beta-phosphoglucomutase-like phosphatase (HAD superfamily)
MRRFDLLIFDMDGVLANTSPCHERAYQDLWREIGIEGPPYHTIAGRKTSDVVGEFSEALKSSAEQKTSWVLFKQMRAREYLSTQDIFYSDSAVSLSSLAECGVPTALGTSASRENTEMILNRLGFASFFPIIVTAEDVTQGKPSPEIYLNVIARAGVQPERVLVIEDSIAGLQAGVAAGASVASVRSGEKLDDPNFIGSFSDLCELLPALGIGVS